MEEVQKITPTDGEADDEFEISVAISGDTFVIGSVGDDIERGYDSGTSYVYTNIGRKWIKNGMIVTEDGVIFLIVENSNIVSGS